jgi:hypothetical protein
MGGILIKSSSMKPIHILPVLLFLLVLSACAPSGTPVAPVASSGAVLYQEEFEDNASGWDRISNENGIMDYDGGGYRMLIHKPDTSMWSTPEKNFGDVRVEADVLRLSGPQENRSGLICRYQDGNFYFFLISNDGYYAIGKFSAGQAVLLGQEEMQTSDYIQKEAANHLRADCVGNTLTFYINNNQVASVQDSTFANGDVGLLAGAFSQPGVDVLFDHFTVTQP